MIRTSRWFSAMLASLMLFTAAVQPVQAALITTEQIAGESAQPAGGSKDRLAIELARPEVQARLIAMGVDTGKAAQRVASLTDAEAALMLRTIDSSPAGGDVLGVIVLVFFVLLVTDILGFTKIFPFTRSVR